MPSSRRRWCAGRSTFPSSQPLRRSPSETINNTFGRVMATSILPRPRMVDDRMSDHQNPLAGGSEALGFREIAPRVWVRDVLPGQARG